MQQQPAAQVGAPRAKRTSILALIISALAIGVLGVGVWVSRPAPVTVHIEGLEEGITFQTRAKDVEGALSERGITLGERDRVSPQLTTSIRQAAETTIVIRRAVPVTVVADGQEVAIETAAEKVREALAEANVKVGARDRIAPGVDMPIRSGMTVQVTRVTEERTVLQEEIPFDTVRREDPSLTRDETVVVQDGETGLMEIVKVATYEDGVLVSEEVIEENIVAHASPLVLAYGTAQTVSRGGQTYRYSRALTMEATGYTAGPESNPWGNGYTYTGMKAVPGIVAVDPNVIPLYTRLYVEGYGPALAADIGGAIKGNKIDLVFETVAEALAWGRRPVTVYILD